MKALPGRSSRPRVRIGYVELIYASSNTLSYATMKNASGEFVEPHSQIGDRAAAGAKFEKNTDFRVSITNAPGKGAYPISSFTWLLVHTDTPDAAKGKVVRDFLVWMITPEAQKMARDLQYAELPDPVVSLIEARCRPSRRPVRRSRSIDLTIDLDTAGARNGAAVVLQSLPRDISVTRP